MGAALAGKILRAICRRPSPQWTLLSTPFRRVLSTSPRLLAYTSQCPMELVGAVGRQVCLRGGHKVYGDSRPSTSGPVVDNSACMRAFGVAEYGVATARSTEGAPLPRPPITHTLPSASQRNSESRGARERSASPVGRRSHEIVFGTPDALLAHAMYSCRYLLRR